MNASGMPNTCKSYEIILVADGWVTREDLPLGKEYIILNPYMLYGEKRNLPRDELASD